MKIIRLKKKQFISDLKKIIKLDFKYYGKNKFFTCFVSSKKNIPNSLFFVEKIDKKNLLNRKGIVVLEKKNSQAKSQIVTKNPRIFFVKLLEHFLKKEIKLTHYPVQNYYNNNLNYFKKNKITVSKSSYIGKKVKIGKNSFIGKNVVIYPNCVLGKNVKILDNSVIGCLGLGYLRNKMLMPHLGSVIIEDNVSVGANCTVVRGTLENTKIKKNVKIANNVNVGHNVIIKENSLISSSVSIAGGAIIQQSTNIGLGAKIKNNIHIGKNSQIGIGSVVVKSLKKNSSVFGNPSRPINLKKKIL